MVEVMTITATSFKRPHAGPAALSATNPEANYHRPMPPPETHGHSWACMGLFVGGPHYLYHLHHSLAPVNSRVGTQLHLSTENWVKDLLSIALPIRTRPSFPLRQSLPSGSFHKPLIFIHQRADRIKTTTTEN